MIKKGLVSGCFCLAASVSAFAGAPGFAEQSCKLISKPNSDGTFGLAVVNEGMASAEQMAPLQVEMWNGDDQAELTESLSGGYSSVKEEAEGWVCTGTLTLKKDVTFLFNDTWKVDGKVLRLDRTVNVNGNAPGGFLSAATLKIVSPVQWPQVEWFVPGMIYGNFDLIPDFAIGGRKYYRPGDYTVRIREDRMPAPLMSARFKDGSTLAVLDPKPNGESTAAESMGFSYEKMADEKFQFGAVGAQECGETITMGYWFPGSEGEQSYSEKRPGINGGQSHHRWRWRLHPVKNGLTQQYSVAFSFGKASGFPESMSQSWRWAWQELKPKVNRQDIEATRRCIVDVLASTVVEGDDYAGPTVILSAAPDFPAPKGSPAALMGFCGRAIESGEFILAESLLDHTERGKELRRKGEKILNTFTRLKMNPPEDEGFFLNDGKPRGRTQLYLRSLSDGARAMLRAYRREKENGIEHPEWLAWVQQFADWLLTQQTPEGGFPRAWKAGSGEVLYESCNSSFCPIGCLVLLSQITGDEKYSKAAEKAGDFCWKNGQAKGQFVGGTIDNADVMDKEAAVISMESYLDLYTASGNTKWRERAARAADCGETWMYIWNVPMPKDVADEKLYWKHGASSVGIQLISTGHTLVDAYMCYEVEEYARLYQATGDRHYLEVAEILLHNTKAMVALPGRLLGLNAPGWQQEHYSFSLPRGTGRHQYWLPWVSTSQLNGIFGLMDSDKELYEELAVRKGQ